MSAITKNSPTYWSWEVNGELKSISGFNLELIETLQGHPLQGEIQKAKAIAHVGSVIIESAKVEVQYLDVVGGKGTGFLPKGLTEGEKP